MNAAPILVLQMQRMGDLILSYPLLGRLAALFPEHPLWVLGEKQFFEPLLPFSPHATYFDYEAAPNLKQQPFYLTINLSHRPEAAALAGSLKSDALIGPLLDKNDRLFIKGDWQIYRASLTDNNRYNLFHWADLNCLDFMHPELMLRTVWPKPRPWAGAGGARVGLFLGASQPEKHPDATFWTGLCQRLLTTGMRPVLLGGPAEMALGSEVAASLDTPALNLCGRFSVGELAEFLSRLDLLVTPDTGPMHLAAWIGVPCLNLSLGPVNAWETGPCAPGHYVLHADLDCAPCWRCTRERQFCREALTKGRVASVIGALLDGESLAPDGCTGFELCRSTRDRNGLYDLAPLGPQLEPLHADRLAVARFWQIWFASLFTYLAEEEAQKAAEVLAAAKPELAARMAFAAAAFARDQARDAKMGRFDLANEPEAWRACDPLLHPFSGYAQMRAKNELGSAGVRKELLHLATMLAHHLAADSVKTYST